MAPEIFNNNGEYDYKVDLWSLGCCLYEIVVGNPPYYVNNPCFISMKKIINS
jgi:serine/threonine protein kinase